MPPPIGTPTGFRLRGIPVPGGFRGHPFQGSEAIAAQICLPCDSLMAPKRAPAKARAKAPIRRPARARSRTPPPRRAQIAAETSPRSARVEAAAAESTPTPPRRARAPYARDRFQPDAAGVDGVAVNSVVRSRNEFYQHELETSGEIQDTSQPPNPRPDQAQPRHGPPP